MKSRLIVLLSVWLCALPGLQAAEKLVVYSGRSDKFVQPVVDSFTRQTGIEVILHSGSATALLNKLKLEQERTDADLFISNDAGTLQQGAQEDLFRSLPKAITESVPANFRDPGNTWVGLSARARVLVVNTRARDIGFVKSVFDLADPRLKDRIAITQSGNESYVAGVTVYMEVAGVEKTRAWLKGMKVNINNEVFAKHGKIVAAVAEGKKDVGLVNHYYIYRHLDENPAAPIRILMPDQGKDGMGVAWNVAGAAVVKHAKNISAAEKFMAYMVSVEGQQQFAEVNREYPVRSGVVAAKEVPAAGSYKVADVPMNALGLKRGPTLDLLEDVGMP